MVWFNHQADELGGWETMDELAEGSVGVRFL